jgi:hypothetical protein
VHRSAHDRLLAWLAVCVLALQALAPAFGFAPAAPGAHSAMVEVCTASGMRWIPVDDGASRDAPATAAGEHCALCTGSAWVAPASPAMRLPRRLATIIDPPSVPARAHRSRAPPHDAPPRAPPHA